MGSRLGNAELFFESLHPVFLPAKHPLTEQIIDAYYQNLLHTGTEFMLAHIRQHFWIVNERKRLEEPAVDARPASKTESSPPRS